MFVIVPRVAKWFFSRLESEKHSHYIFVLAVVFFAAFIAEVAGIEPIIGAFVAGLELNKLIPHSSALMNRIEFIGNSLFIPFFLISVGMIVDVTVLLNGPYALYIAVVLSVVAIIGKWMAAYATQKVLRYNALQRRLIFGLSSSHAAAILAVILVGYKAKILDDNILNGTIILILITCIVASLVTENAAKKLLIAEQQNPDDNKDEILNEHILLPVANISNIESLLDFALYIKNNKSPNPVSILSCIPNDENAENNVLVTKGELERFVRQASAREKKANIIITLDHNPASGIARTSKEIMADIIIIGWPRKQGMLDKIIGDKVENIINNTDKTIFICQFNRPFVNHKRLIIIAPPHAEKENGFIIWLSKMHRLAAEFNLPVLLYGNNETSQATYENLKNMSPVLPFNTVLIDDWEDLLIAKDIRRDDIIVLTLARKGSLSFLNQLEQIPAKLEKHYPDNTKMMIYPQRYSHHYKVSGYESYTSGTINKGIATIQKLGKDIGSLLKSEKKN